MDKASGLNWKVAGAQNDFSRILGAQSRVKKRKRDVVAEESTGSRILFMKNEQKMHSIPEDYNIPNTQYMINILYVF